MLRCVGVSLVSGPRRGQPTCVSALGMMDRPTPLDLRRKVLLFSPQTSETTECAFFLRTTTAAASLRLRMGAFVLEGAWKNIWVFIMNRP